MKCSLPALTSTSLLLALVVVAPGLVASCDTASDDDTTTTGKRVTLRTQVELEGEPTFENAFGWQIELRRVLLSSGAMYYFEGHPIESAARGGSTQSATPVRLGRTQPSPWRSLLSPGVAHAHPGHYDEGDARGEMLSPASFDLLAGPTTLADGEGVSGLVRSARFTYQDPPTGALASELDGSVVLVEGTGTKGELSKVFQLRANRAEVLDASGEPVVEGCTFEEVDIQSEGTVTLHVSPAEWLDQAELDDVPDSPDGQPVLVGPEDRAKKAFVRGLKKSSGFVFTYSPK